MVLVKTNCASAFALGGKRFLEETVNLGPKSCGLLAQRAGTFASSIDARLCASYAFGKFSHSGHGCPRFSIQILHAGGDVADRRVLLHNALGYLGRVMGDFGDRRGDTHDLVNRRFCCRTYPVDLLANVFCCSGSLLGKSLDFRRDDRKALAGISCPCSFDRRIEGKKVRLFGDRSDQVHDFADPLRGICKVTGDLPGLSGPRVCYLPRP